jgi:hypothetical protein
MTRFSLSTLSHPRQRLSNSKRCRQPASCGTRLGTRTTKEAFNWEPHALCGLLGSQPFRPQGDRSILLVRRPSFVRVADDPLRARY